jgi:hypothetical protein
VKVITKVVLANILPRVEVEQMMKDLILFARPDTIMRGL